MPTEVVFYMQDIDYHEKGVRLLGITEDKKKVVVIDKNFDPYFYAILKKGVHIDRILEILKSFEAVGGEEVTETKAVEPVEKKLFEQDVRAVKIIAENPEDIPILRRRVEKLSEVDSVYEYDIPFLRRYLIDKNLTPLTLLKAIGEEIDSGGLNVSQVIKADKIEQMSSDTFPKLKILAFDIEVFTEGIFPDPKENPIISISYFGTGGFRKTVTWKGYSNAPDHVHFVGGELDILEDFQKTIEFFDPDILVGYNSDKFDIPYIMKRMEKFKIAIKSELDGSEVKIEYGAPHIKGLCHLDVFPFIRRVLSPSLTVESFKLADVSKVMLGESKLKDIAAKDIGKVWQEGDAAKLRLLSEYNLRDAELTYKLCQKVLPTAVQLVSMLNLPIFDVVRMTYGQLAEWFLIKNAGNRGVIVPNRPAIPEARKRMRESYAGAFVLTPKPGLYRDIFVFDFRSLYPSVIVAHNICPTTYSCECCSEKEGHLIGVGGHVYKFCSKEKGFVPELIEKILARRGRVKDVLMRTDEKDEAYHELSARVYALKTMANSFYGYLGFPNARWYSIQCARSITAFGRKYIHQVIREAKSFGFEVLYSDTDSVFMRSDKKTKIDAHQFIEKINTQLPNPMELDYDGFYPSGIFLEKKSGAEGAKKRYALLKEKGGLVIRGLESRRGDWSNLAKIAQKEVLRKVLSEQKSESAERYIQDIIGKINKREVDINDLVIRTKLTRALKSYKSRGPHVAAAELAKAKGHRVGRGFMVSYIVGPGSGRISDRVVLAEDAKLSDYDPGYYIEKQVMGAVQQIFAVMGKSEDAVKSGQVTLEGF